MTDDADCLLAGPRGRRLCFMLAGGLDSGIDLADLELPDAILRCVVNVVSTGRYWQAQDALDRRLAKPEWRDFLRPTAMDLAADRENAWWREPPPFDNQFHVERLGQPTSIGPSGVDVGEELGQWRTQVLETEAETSRDSVLGDRGGGGPWWSSLTDSRVPATSRPIDRVPAVGAVLTDDDRDFVLMGCRRATLQAVPRVYEIDGPGAWTALVARFPLNVTWSRRHLWYAVTGESGPWLIPDYRAMAAEYDAVHLSLWGHLTTAGRPLQVGDHQTMLAGWNPDETYWLSGDVEFSDEFMEYRMDEDDVLVWHLVET